MTVRRNYIMPAVTLALCLVLTVPAFASEYTVVKGDCLWKIARNKLGSGYRWGEIYDANRSQIRDPNLIYPNQVFEIPDGGTAAAAPTEEKAAVIAAAEAPEAEKPAAEAPAPEKPAAEKPTEAPAPEKPVETPTAQPAAEPVRTSAPAAAAGEIRQLAGSPTDYADKNNWARLPEPDKPADTFYLYPTACVGSGSDDALVPADDADMRAAAMQNIELVSGVFSDSTNVFAPFYRQSTLSAIAGLTGDGLLDYQRGEQRTDVYAALDYYFEHCNGGRPFILAGDAQGSVMLKLVLQEYLPAHPEYFERMIAAYIPGYSITNEDISANSALRFAEGADDVGVIVSWNTEGPDNAGSICVLPGALAINPINWKRDDTYAPASDNAGSRIVNPITRIVYNSMPGLADAKVDPARGVVICTNADLPFTQPAGLSGANPFGAQSYHNCDYTFYYFSIRENVAARTAAWFAAAR